MTIIKMMEDKRMKVRELMDLLDAMPSEYEVAVVDGEKRKKLDYMMNIGENCVIFIKPIEAEDEGRK